MSNVLTDWRKALMTQLDTQLQGGSFTVIAGERDGPSRDRKIACVFAPPVVTDSEVDMARPVMIVRAWIPDPKTPKRQTPPDPEPVEQLMIDLAICLQAVQVLPAVGDHGLFAFVTEIQPDYPDFGVQATLRGWMQNPAVLA